MSLPDLAPPLRQEPTPVPGPMPELKTTTPGSVLDERPPVAQASMDRSPVDEDGWDGELDWHGPRETQPAVPAHTATSSVMVLQPSRATWSSQARTATTKLKRIVLALIVIWILARLFL